MNYFPVFDDGPNSLPSRGRKRDSAAIHRAMLNTAGSSPVGMSSADPNAYSDETVGLSLGKLEDQRWKVSPVVSREKLLEAGLPYEGRRAGLIYSWRSIFKAEGIDAEVARTATRETHPHMFDDMVDTTAAADLLGFKDASSIRKLIIAGQFNDTAFIRFGSRGVFRFRPATLLALRKKNSIGRIV